MEHAHHLLHNTLTAGSPTLKILKLYPKDYFTDHTPQRQGVLITEGVQKLPKGG
jgi:hypothetical protein